jgi:hypothetical protein
MHIENNIPNIILAGKEWPIPMLAAPVKIKLLTHSF